MLYFRMAQLLDFKKQVRVRGSLGVFLRVFSIGTALVVSFLSTVSAQEQRHFVYQHSPRNIPELRMVRVKGLESDGWLDELELEYKNVSEKPIYYVSIYLILTETEPYLGKEHFKMEFGNPQIAAQSRLATPEDTALKPGKSFVFKIPKPQVEAHKKAMLQATGQEKFLLPITKVLLDLYHVEFGDGTGYTAGELLPRKR